MRSLFFPFVAVFVGDDGQLVRDATWAKSEVAPDPGLGILQGTTSSVTASIDFERLLIELGFLSLLAVVSWVIAPAHQTADGNP